MDIYIKNLHPNLREEELRVLFEPFGPVISTSVVRDKDSGISKGFGFVKMHNAIDAQRAIDDMNGRELGGKVLGVSEAIPKDQKRSNNFEKNPDINQSVAFSTSFRKTKRDIDEDGWATVKFENDKQVEEDLILEVQNETEFSKSILDDGMIKITFKN